MTKAEKKKLDAKSFMLRDAVVTAALAWNRATTQADASLGYENLKLACTRLERYGDQLRKAGLI